MSGDRHCGDYFLSVYIPPCPGASPMLLQRKERARVYHVFINTNEYIHLYFVFNTLLHAGGLDI